MHEEDFKGHARARDAWRRTNVVFTVRNHRDGFIEHHKYISYHMYEYRKSCRL